MPGMSAAPNSEWSILLAACSVTPADQKHSLLAPLLQQSVRWPLLFALAEEHGVQPLLLQSLLDVEQNVPGENLLSLKQSCQVNLHKALLLSRELIRIVGHLSALGMEVMPYKGLALAEIAYGDIALRQSGDIDLLIRASDLNRVRDAVRELGYTSHEVLSEPEERAYLKSGYECSFDGAAGPNLLELQWGILPRFYAIDFDMAGLFERAANVSVAGQPTKTPSASDLFLVLSAHAAKHVWGRLIWLCDIARMMGLPGLDWDWIQLQSEDLGIKRILQVGMLLANRLLGAVTPAAAQKRFSDDRDAEELAAEIQKHILSDKAYNVESVAYFRLMMRLREKRSDRLRFLTRLVFTPGPSEWKAIRLPEPLFPLYRMVRLSRLAAKLVGA